ncbi:MAG TPA: hypothetical protein VF458_16505 [Ktedonobacteraceae bacterium]
MPTEETSRNEVAIACNPDAIPAEMRDQWIENSKRLYAAVQEIQDMPAGYRFRLLPDSTMLLKVAEYIANERLCCPFLHFTVEVEANEGPFWLCLTGCEGVKEYIRSIFVTNDLLNQRVIEVTD